MLTVLVPSLMASQTYLSSKAAIPDMPIVREIKELPVYDNMRGVHGLHNSGCCSIFGIGVELQIFQSHDWGLLLHGAHALPGILRLTESMFYFWMAKSSLCQTGACVIMSRCQSGSS